MRIFAIQILIFINCSRQESLCKGRRAEIREVDRGQTFKAAKSLQYTPYIGTRKVINSINVTYLLSRIEILQK